MKKKTVFIGHPIGGDIKSNAKKILKIFPPNQTKKIRDDMPKN